MRVGTWVTGEPVSYPIPQLAETQTLWVKEKLKKFSPKIKGAAYLGIGGVQNLDFIATVKPAAAILVDVDPRVVDFMKMFFDRVRESQDLPLKEAKKMILDDLEKKNLDQLAGIINKRSLDVFRLLAKEEKVFYFSGDITSPTLLKKIFRALADVATPLGALYFSDFLTDWSPTGYIPRVVNLWDLFNEADYFHPSAQTFMAFRALPMAYKSMDYHYTHFSRDVLLEILEEIEGGEDFPPAFLALLRANYSEPCWNSSFISSKTVNFPDDLELELADLERVINKSQDIVEKRAWSSYGSYLKRIS